MINAKRLLAAASIAIGAAVSVPAVAQEFELAFPVDCVLGEDCFIQNYFDRDPTTGRQDYGCGHLSYDGHGGTDIALYTEADIARDVAVTPVAPGRIRAARDGMPDIRSNHPDAPDLTGRSCGNAVVIDHEGGWTSIYCHLREGSILVEQGEDVSEETQLGSVGMSGWAEFPHLHLAIQRGRRDIDPFLPDSKVSCGVTENSLWADDIDYVAAGFLTVGGSDAVPSFIDVKAGAVGAETLPSSAPALVFWAHLFGSQIGDSLQFIITGPDGLFLNQTLEFDRNQARSFRAAGRRNSSGRFTPGLYAAKISLVREGQTIDQIAASVEVTQ